MLVKFETMSAYTPETVTYVRVLYVVLIIIWTVLVVYLRLWNTLGGMVLVAPVLLFTLAFTTAPYLCDDIESFMGQANCLSLGLMIAMPLLVYLNNSKYPGDKQRYTSAIIMALIFSSLALVDVWVPPAFMTPYKHFRSALHVMSLTLFIYALLHHFLTRSGANLL